MHMYCVTLAALKIAGWLQFLGGGARAPCTSPVPTSYADDHDSEIIIEGQRARVD